MQSGGTTENTDEHREDCRERTGFLRALMFPYRESRLLAELFFVFVERGDAGGEGGFFDEHHGNAVADGVFQAAGFSDQVVALEPEFALGDWAAEELEQVGVNCGGGRGGGGVGHGCSLA